MKNIFNNFRLLKKNDKIGLISPASGITNKQLLLAVNNIKKLGLMPFYFDSIRDNYAYLAGKDNQRVEELHKMFTDKSVKAIFCIRGGYGTTRILDKIDYDLIKQHPKIIIGFSDITALLQAIYKHSLLPSFHGIVATSKFTDYTISSFNKTFLNPNKKITIKSRPNKNQIIINPGITSGTMIGGNLSLLTSLIGTKFDISWKDKVVFIEEIAEPLYKIDRMLTQLSLSGKLSEAKAIIFGIFNKCESEHPDISLEELILEKIKPLNVPSVYGFSFGHIENQAIFPVGLPVSFDADRFEIDFFRD